MDLDNIPDSTLAAADGTFLQQPRNHYTNKIDMTGISQALRDQARANVRRSRNRGGGNPHSSFLSTPPAGRGMGGTHLSPLPNTRRQGNSITSTTLSRQPQEDSSTTDPSCPETEQTLPTPAIIEREKLLRRKPIRDLTLEDFLIDHSSEGTSLLVSLLVREIASIHDEMTEFQQARIAAHAILHHPLRLLNYLQHTSSMNDFTISSLSTYPTPTVDPYAINPMNTPFLIPDDTLRLKMDHPSSLTDEDYRDILNYYVECFYPAHYDALSAVIQDMNSLALENCAHENGALTIEFDRLLSTQPEYSPPVWIDLALIIDTSSQSFSNNKLFDPMECIGMSQQDFASLPIDQMKQTAMAKLPQAMASITDTQTILTVLNALRETPRTKMTSFLTPETFLRFLHPNAVDTMQFYCRLRLAPLRGKRNALWAATPGAILSHWLQAALTLLLPRYTLALVSPPHLLNQSQIPISSPHLIPMVTALDPYALEVQKDQSDCIVQMDFWILTNCPDLDNVLPRRNEDAHHKDHRKYLSDLSQAAMRLSNQEQLPKDMEVCVILAGSVSRDCNKRILAELKDRVSEITPLVGSIYISWITLRAQSDRASIMAKCILAPTIHAEATRDIFRTSPPLSDAHLVTRHFDFLVLPEQSHSNYWTTLSQAIMKQVSYLESITQVSYSNLTNFNPFTTVPPITFLANSDITKANADPVASLILHGQISRTEGPLQSPVTHVATDLNGTRLYIYAPKSSAATLLLFAEHLYDLLPTWTQQLKPISIDLADVRRTLRDPKMVVTSTKDNRSREKLTPYAQPATIAPRTNPRTTATSSYAPPPTYASATQAQPPPIFPPPPMHPSTLPTISLTQYQTLTNQLTQFDQRLSQYGATLAEILNILNSRAFPTQEQWVECIVSPITSTIHSEGDSIKSHHTETTSNQHTALMQPLADQTQAIKDLSLLTQTQNQVTNLAHTSIMNSSDQTKTILSSAAADITFLRQYIDKGSTTTVHEPSLHSNALDRPSTPLPAREEQTDNFDSPIQELDVEYPDPPDHPQRGECTSCHEYSDNLRQCGHCELLFDDPCILIVRDRLTNEEDYQCLSCRRKTHPLTGLDGLTESEDEKSHSESTTRKVTESISTATTLEPTNEPTQKPPAKGLRPKGATSARSTITRTTPPITRNSLKPTGRIPPDPNE